MLQLSNVHCLYGKIAALKGINLEIKEGEIVALIGANGAGKTTTLKAISSLIPVSEGKIEFLGEEITNLPAHVVVNNGIAHVPEGRQVFAELSVADNLLLGGYTIKDRAYKEKTRARLLKRFPRLEERKGQLAGTLSGGEQQMLAIARGLMSKPRLLLLDEPSMGLAPKLVYEVFETVKEINEQGTTVLIVEQNAHVTLKIADRAYILQNGEIVLSGDSREIASKEEVKKAYLGG